MFEFCWPPPLDRIQSRDFRSTAFKYLEELKAAGAFGPAFVLRRSILDECRGARYDQLINFLVAYVMKVVYGRLNQPACSEGNLNITPLILICVRTLAVD